MTRSQVTLVSQGSAYTYVAFLCCFLMVLIEGFDSQIMALAVPQIAAAWHRIPSEFAVVFSATAVGMGFGAPAVGLAADKIERKWILVFSALLLGLLTTAIVAVSSVMAMSGLRLVAGVCLGGTLVTSLAIAGDLSPAERRARNTMLVYIGAPIGAISGSLLGGYLFRFGDWRLIFYVAGAMTLTAVLLPLLLLRSGGRRAVARVVPGGQTTSDSLFTRKYRLRTLFLCTAQVAALTAAYLLTSWLPTIVANVTGSLPQASLFNSLIYVGAIAGVVSMAAVVVRVGALRLLTGVYFVSALAALVVHFSMQNPGPKLVVALLGLGMVMLGGQMVLSTLAASLYPLELRARGLGLATGVGRVGALLGPAIGAALLASPHQKGQVFLYLCGIVVVTASTILAMLLVTRKDEAEHE